MDANFLQERGTNNYSRQQAYFSYIRGIKGLIFRRGYYSKWTMPPTEKAVDVYLATDNVYLDHPRRNSYALRRHCQGYFKHLTRSIAEQFQWKPPFMSPEAKPEPFGSGDPGSR